MVFQKGAKRTIVPGIRQSAIDFASWINKAARNEMGLYFFESFLCHNSIFTSFLRL